MDLVEEIKACAFLQHSKGHFLYSATTTQSMMDYSSKAIKDGVVDSPPSCAIVLVVVNTPSPLQGEGTGEYSKSKCWNNNGAQCNLNLEFLHPPNNELHKI